MTRVVHCQREPYDVYIGRAMPATASRPANDPVGDDRPAPRGAALYALLSLLRMIAAYLLSLAFTLVVGYGRNDYEIERGDSAPAGRLHWLGT